ncbi:hypothetical protein SBA1_260009 [Candidatus Sulfotelmatobacter kueseliae]|uniref:Uncharacterized protein n=1 Tax=Candidatus Sulfotelmatobacter kueseliae TaxID=2042962 RepID=A0A2U3KHS6_9BACT|nr:hypothetical protein SBA1_260009 [Candidatus Sulfotelmatobacter kueseliae]
MPIAQCDREDKPFRISALRRDIQQIADEEQRTITQVCEMLLHEGLRHDIHFPALHVLLLPGFSCGGPPSEPNYGTIRSLLFLSETGVRPSELALHLLISTISRHPISPRERPKVAPVDALP